ncbi:acetyl-CoA synthetase-like protein [Lojkania enalia]|uniref:Acetyl-CoA synthetase-like protein n=1 Tax=Lojkania enalia TaxID=147567 RepID=A0A9P4KFS2_9PLEO|nr:acetyl-CoA synthetase-like protein [Didymosphaeria enalia]
MASNITPVHSCHFPATGRQDNGPKRPLSVRVELRHLDLLQKLLGQEKGPEAFSAVIRAAWAMLLRCYTGLSEVCFGFEEVGRSVVSEGAPDSSTFERATVIPIAEDMTIAQLIHVCDEDKSIKAIMNNNIQYNTSVMVRHGVQTATASQKQARGSFMPDKCNLRLLIKHLKSGVSIFLEYRNSFIPTEQAKNVASTMDKVMSNVLGSPEVSISKLDYLSDRNRLQIEKWNSKPLDNVETTIHEIIRAIVKQCPKEESVCSWDGTLTYEELDKHVCKVALHLIGLGVGPEVIVPLCFNKSKWNVVAMLAVLYAGGAFLPLDPAYPPDRIHHLVKSTNAKAMLCSRLYADKLSEAVENLIPVDSETIESFQYPAEPLKSRANSRNAAYVIPTSGTTGQPKLTLIEHGNYCTGVKGHVHGLGLDTVSPVRSLQFAAHSFDASIIEHLTPLMIGGTVCIPDEQARLNDVAKVINEMRVTWAVLTPTFVRFLEPSMVPTLRTICLVGEAMSQANLDTWTKINLVNGYGPSECAVASVCNPGMTAKSDPKNIGYPSSCRAWVVKPENHHERVPIGCVGELLLEGCIVARGYLNDEQRTNQVFVNNVAWASGRSFRGYLTGDLVTQNPDGSFNFIGRKDNQVKYHGQRIELLEIEHHINRDASIKHCLVALPKSGHVKERLVAVVSLTENEGSNSPLSLFEASERASIHAQIEEIRARISERLPLYMVPTVWIAVEALPSLVSGKLDRRLTNQWLMDMPKDVYQSAIPAAEGALPDEEPATTKQALVRTIWARVLNLPENQVSLNRSFLSIGGDSISAMQVMGHCRKNGVGIGVQDILRSKSIYQLAATAKDIETSFDDLVEDIEKPFDLSPIQSIWYSLPNQGHGHFNQSFYLRILRKTDRDEFNAAVEKLVSRHSMLRARFDSTDGVAWQQRITEDVEHSYRFRYLTVNTKREIDDMIEDSQRCLDPIKGPLFAADLYDYGSEQHAFLVGHHLVIDLVSWRLLLEELEELLQGGSLLPPTLPFQRWCQLQQDHANGLSLQKVLPSVDIPALDFSYWGIEHQDNTYGKASHESFELDHSTTALFLGDCHNALKTEPVEVLLAALIQSWSHVFTDRPLPAIFNEGHGREPWQKDIDVSRTVGWFTTIYPVFVNPAEDAADTVRLVKDFRRQIPANGRPYFARKCLTSDGREHFRTHWPMEISFNYLGQYQQLERPDALLQPLESMAGETREAGGTADVGHGAPRFGLFEISAFVFKGQLRIAFTFNRVMRHQQRIRQWVSECCQTLTMMIQRLISMPPTPTFSDFPLLSLTEDRFQLMLKRLAELGISALDIEDAYPCSNMQEGLLLSQTKDAGFYAAVTIHEVKFPGDLPDSRKLGDAWKRVISRHPALRTIFLENIGNDEGLYDQVVLRQPEANIVHIDCMNENEALAIFKKQRSISYENGRTPPHRLTICTTTDRRVFCCLEISHAIMDGHTMSMLFDDIRRAYANTIREDGPLYSDYISYLMEQHKDSSLKYWKSYLNGSEVCSFPMLNDGVVTEKQLCSIRVDFGNLSILDLQTFCDSNGITLSNVFHTAWALTLSSYVGSNDVTFGYLTSARDGQEIYRAEEIAGPLINTLVCRVNFSDERKSLLDVLRNIQQDYMDSLPHRHVALAEIQHVLELSGASLFNTSLSYRRLPVETPADEAGLKFIEIAPIYDPTEYPVSLNIEVSDEAAMVDLDYWTNHLSEGQAANVASTFIRALENIVFHTEQSLTTLDHLSGKHWQQILNWNIMPETLYECIHHRFAAQVAAQPNAPAIRGFDGDYSYAELDIITDHLAYHLIELGVGPEVFVPTCFDKSSYTVIAMLAVLKAGGAAVPLDAKHPKPALESRVEDTQAQVVLTSAARSELFEDIVPDVVIVDSVLLEDLQELDIGDEPICASVQPHNPAFVIFTSGSTGRPKGVILEHAAMATSANAHGTNLGIGPGSRFLQFASYTFDNSLEEMFTTLQRGGCVCVPSEEQRMNDLASAIAELDANFMDLTPTVAALLSPADVPTIKGMALGGEALTKAVVDQWSNHVHLHGQYGPSEASINSAWKDFKNGGEATNIGRAIGSVSWIVHPENRNRLVPIGCKGELLIEGPILSRGYLGDPKKTELAFIRDPDWARASETTGRRFYCTGDLVHYTSSGEMMYLGRKDSQVKLNGQRIELGEIEHNLKLNLPFEAQSAVELVKLEGEKPMKALAAFLCLSEETSSAANDVSSSIGSITDNFRTIAREVEVALSNALPAYYVPSLFIPLTSMPMTTSGKLDRKILRQLAQSIDDSQLHMYRLAGKSGRAPSGPAEGGLARLWASILNVALDSVGADDSFFRLGGDSIGAMRLVTASRKEGLLLTVANIFAQPKLADMAATAIMLSSEELSAQEQPDIDPFELVPKDARRRIIEFAASECAVFPDSIEDIYPCSRLQEGLIALSTKEPGAYVAETIYRLPPDTNLDRFRQAWDRVVASETVLRTRIIYTEDCGFLQIVVRNGVQWKQIADLQDIRGEDRHLPAHHGGPLASYAIVGEGTVSPFFVWTAHHAVYDGWSLPALLCKVEACYYQSAPEPLLSVPYSRFIKYLSTIDGKESDDFWMSTFEDITAPQYPQLPYPDYKVQASSQLMHYVSVTRKAGLEITMPSMIRAAWGLLLATYSGSDDVLWGETSSGREVPVPGIEEILGATIATSPMRLRLNREVTIQQYLQDVQRASSAALPFQFAGLQHIRKLNSDTAVACEFQSLLAIVAGDGMKDPEGGLWDLQSAGTIGTNFFNYALIFNVTVTKDGVHVEAHYDDQVIQTWLVQRLLQQFGFILHQFNTPKVAKIPLADFRLLSQTDEEVIAAWNSEPVNVIHKCIHNAIFQDQVMLSPDSIALDAWDTDAMTYRELDERSTRLASRLISLGVKPQTFVPLCFDKSGWTIVAMLAVMKSGAAFVPLDFEAPILRLREIVGDVDANMILCASQYEDLCQSIPCKTFVVNWNTTERQPGRLYTLPYVQSNTPAYAFFTSGSTGKPKGAVINHYSFVSSSAAFAPAMGISGSSRVLQFASYTFDACLIEIISTLMFGGTVCVPDQASRTNDLPGVINKFHVNWAALTPSVVRTIQPSQVPQLKTLILVGEAMSQQDLLTWVDKVMLGNGYGPTECSAVATVNIMTPMTKPYNLGKVITARGWVVSKDNHNILVPLGAVGELLLEGGGVGAGYLKNPEKTASAFITDIKWNLGTDVHDESSPRRFYKTGDMVKYNEDGTMMYLGRKDSQTKVRGQRLELSEVEHHLIDDPLVQNALASVPNSGPCLKRLVGVISLQNMTSLPPTDQNKPDSMQLLPTEMTSTSISTIRDRLYERLPSYMVPSLWVAVAAFPLMPSGKLDRRRIIQWLERMDNDVYRTVSTLGLEAPNTDVSTIESKLQAIFAVVLNLPSEDIRLNQSFLHLGGDSIAAMQVSSQCRAQGFSITVQDIIRSKSIADLASKVSVNGEEMDTPNNEYDLPFDLSPIQQVFFNSVGDTYNHFNQSVVLRLGRTFEAQELQNAIDSLVTTHPMLRARYLKDDSTHWKQYIVKGTENSFRLRHHRVPTASNEYMQPIIDESEASLDIISGPTFSVDVFNIEDTFSQAIALIAHHLIIDVVSWGIVLEDLQNLLNGVNLAPQSLPFHSWLQHQAEQAKQDTARKVLPISGIPTGDFDYWGMSRKDNLSCDVITEDIELGAKDSMLLLGAHDALATEPLDVFIAGLLESFRKVFADRSTITVHNEGHGREPFNAKQDLSRTVGWFTTLTPIHLPVPPEEPTDIVSTIKWVKDLRERIPDKGRPYFAYRMLTQEGQDRFTNHWPAEVTFNYLGRMQNLERKDALLSKMDNITTSDVGPHVQRFSLFEVTALVTQGAIRLSFSFNRHMRHQPEIKQWILECRQTLVDAVEKLLQVRPGPSLSDFKLLPLTYNGMSKLSAVLPSGITLNDIENIYPASPMQQGLLLSQLKHPEFYAYHCIFEVQSADPGQVVSPRKLAEAWKVVVHRHPALRTVFIDSLSKTGLMDQIVFKDKPGRVSWMLDCDDANAAEVLRAQQPADYREFNSPHRLTICKTRNDKVWVKLEMSHAICDGSSIPNLLRDLSRAYQGKLSRSDQGPQYSDFIAHILSTSRDSDLNYWKAYLAGVEPCYFPKLTDGKQGPHETSSHEVHLPGSSIQAFCKKNGVTVSNVLQLAWAILLHCYVGSSDVSFGVVASGRDIPIRNIEEAAGCFVNMLICRVNLTDETHILHLLELLQTDSVNAITHQNCSLADVQHELQLPSLFNTVFTYQRRQLSKDPEQTALLYENVEAADPGEYHITVNADVSVEGTTVDFGFWKDKICPMQAKNMVQTFEKILRGIIFCVDSQTTLGDLDFLTSGSLQQIMQWNKELPPPIRRCVHDLVHEQALLRPQSAKAIEGWDGIFTYQEFDEVTTRLAIYLNTLGISTETFVPILFEKSSWAIVSMIAIMKAGGAYVPLDPKHPPNRLRQLIGDVGAEVVLCSRNYNAKACEIAATATVIDQNLVSMLPPAGRRKPKSEVTPDNAAYCLFTSGTTGIPKGTIIPHQSFCTSAYAFTRHMHMNASSRTFQFASYTFDASCAEILAALTVGATICVPTEDERMSDPAGAIRRLRATWTFQTPSVLSTMKPERISCLRTLVVGGEAVPGLVIEKWSGKVCFIDGYGPTETTVFACVGHKSTLNKEKVNSDGSNIGIPSGCRLWIVHPRNHNKLMPIGSVGELVIEGYTTARGYLGDEVKTARSFIENPAWTATLPHLDNEHFHTTRMYKSGDLVRWNSDGTICYIGRKDTQIKLNGQRIELGEIEYHVKSKFPENFESAVELVAPASRRSTKALAVFFTMENTDHSSPECNSQLDLAESSTADELLLPMNDSIQELCKSIENALVGVLPAYMIPSIFLPVKKMPWTTASKLDRNRLRTLVQNLSKESIAPYRLNSTINKRKPTTKAERKLQKLVCSVLNLPESSVGLEDSFIRLGGDSVAAMRLVAAAQSEHIELSVIDIFKQPKLSELAARCNIVEVGVNPSQTIEPFQLLRQSVPKSRVLSELSEQCRVPEDKILDAYPASPLQEAFITLSIKQPGAYVAQHILKLSSTVDINKFKAAWEKAVQEMDLLRTRIAQTQSGAFLQIVLAEDLISWHETSALEQAEGKVTQIPEHLGGKLAAYTLVHAGPDERYFVWSLHHSLYDGWSIPIMLQRVEQIYQIGFSDIAGVPYARFIKYILDSNTEEAMRFWKDKLAGASPYQFPQKYHSNSDEVPNGQVLLHTAKFSSHRHSDITPSTVIRGAWALLLAAYTNSNDVVFGETLTGRDINVSGITEICGPTLTTVPTRVMVDHSMTVLDFLHGIAQNVTDRIPYQHTGLADIRRIDQDTASACDFQNLLAIQAGGQDPLETIWKFHNSGIQTNYFTYPLVIECKADQTTVDIAAYYDQNIMSSWQVQRILYQLDSLLSQLNSVVTISDITVFSEQDFELVCGWNARQPIVVDETVPSLFLKQVSSQPYSTAVSAFDGEFTYSELLELASRLADQLVKWGVGPEKLVPICVDKSRWAVVAIMGVLIAGGGYVPLSPEHPASRHRQIIQDCEATVLICSLAYQNRFTSTISKVFTISESTIRQLPASQSDVILRSKGTNVCYVLYTSGSTGIPKGVIIEHQAIASSSTAICKALHIKPSSRVFQFGSFVFDASVMEILTTLACGATICIPSEHERTTDISSAMNRLKATWTCLTPSVANLIESPETVPTLKTFASGAEALTPETIKKWGSKVHLLNAYGPTEGSVVAIANDQVSTQQDPSNIGFMLQSARGWIVNPMDPHQLSPVGAVGELCIEGPLLARGYLNNRVKTAEAFISNPRFIKAFGPTGQVDTRIYRTGDLVQYAPDGSIRYVGRKDNQVKLAGQRMELGEIEHHLQSIEDVRQVVVLMPKSGPGQRKLTCVLSFGYKLAHQPSKTLPWNNPLRDAGSLGSINESKSRLLDLVPSYMVPTVWVAVNDIPTLDSSKLDRKQVAAWFENMTDEAYQLLLDVESGSESTVTATGTTKMLQDIWAKVLNIPHARVKLNKSWLSLGGDSITAMQLLAHCRKEGINLTLNQILRSKSITHLADNIGSYSILLGQGTEYTDKAFELSPIQRFYFASIGDEKNSHFHQSFTLRLSRKVDPTQLKDSADAVVNCHSMLRARFSRDQSGTWHQNVPSNSSNAYSFKFHEVSTLSEIVGFISGTQRTLDIINGPIFAVNLFNSPSDQVIFLTAHHLVVDMVSWRIILGDLEECLTSGSPKTLSREVSFQVWCEKQTAHTLETLQVNQFKEQRLLAKPADLSFWGLDSRHNLYGDVERDSFSLGEDISTSALDHHEVFRTDAVDLFIAAVVHSFSRVFIDRETPTVFNETHGREPWDSNMLDLSRTVGWFTTMYPVHVPISEVEDDVIQTVCKVKDLRRGVHGNGRPYFAHWWLTETGKEQFANHAPIEVLFNYLGKIQQVESKESLFESLHFNEEEELQMSDLGNKTLRPALFEISVSVIHGKIEFSFMYNRWMKNQKGIRRWIAECRRTFEEIIKSLAKIEKPQPTLSDFPLLPLESYDRLNRVVKTFPSVGIKSFDQVENMYPCATMQEGMILSQIKDPQSYWSYSIFEIRAKHGLVDVGKVITAWQRVVYRHPALRTVFVDSVYRGGTFDQIVLRNPDCGAVSFACDDSELEEKLKSIKYANFNGKMMPHLPHQFTIIQTSSGRIYVKLEINHAVIDGGSHAIIRQDLVDAYEAKLPDEEGPLYSDYIKYLRSLPADEAINYWKKQLGGLKPCYFPIAPQHSTKERQLHSLDMDFRRYSEVQVLAERNNISFSNIMLAAWALVLRSYTGSSDTCYGYLASGRNIPVEGIENAVGAFINMLVSRVGFSRSSTLLDVFKAVQNDFIESLPHQHCSLAQFQHDLGLSGQALFNTVVSIQNQSAGDIKNIAESNIIFEHMDAFDPSEFAITVNIDTSRNDEGVRFSYWTDSVSDDEAKNVSVIMTKILDQMITDMNQTVSELDIAIADKPQEETKVAGSGRISLKSTPIFELDDPIRRLSTMPPIPRIEAPPTSTTFANGVQDWGNLIRSIVSEMVPQIVDQILAKNKRAPTPGPSTINDMTNQMVGMLGRRASQPIRGRPNLETGSMRSRRMSVASDTESRINIAADMVAAAGVMATEALKSVPPDFVEKKLLTLWSELLDMVEDSIERDDSFFQLGGDSIIAMRLVGAAREEGLSMTVADVFKNPTFSDMARVVRVAGEVIDQVMSQAGGDASSVVKEPAASSSKLASNIRERASSAWKDFQSIVSEHAILDDDEDSRGKLPTSRESRANPDQMFRKWQGFTPNFQSATSPPRAPSLKRPPPQTIHEDPSTNKSISLLGDPNVDSVISKVQVFKGGISDVLPVTDFQALAITGTLLESRWMLNYFYLDGAGPLDLRKFKQAAFRIVQAFDILRTVFVPYGDRFLQVVLRKLQPDFIYQETDLDLEEYTAELRQKDREHGPRLGETFVQFVVAKQKKTERYRIFMRMSHAQYDGFCLPKILASLQAGYNGLPVSSAPSFGNFVRESAKTVAGAHDHWREILRGSKMTEIVHRYGPNYQRSAGRTVMLRQTLTVPTLSHINITTATVVKAAWASTLARFASQSDIVFGHVISGRNGSVPNVGSIIGPCLNMVPVRVVYRPEWTVLDLLSYIQDQQIANMPYESLGFREITRNCTDWPDWTNFSSVLQHNQNVHEDGTHMQLGGIEYTVGAVGSQEDFADFSILSTSKGGDQLEVTLTYAPNSTITADYAQNVFDVLCTTVITFAEDPYTLLPSPLELTSRSSTTIISEQSASRKKSSEKSPLSLPSPQAVGLSKQEIQTLAAQLRSAWSQILRDDLGKPVPLALDSNFFELGGDIMGLAQVASILDHEGLRIRVEDLIEKCVFVEQISVLAAERRRVVEKEEMSPWGEKGRKGETKEESEKKDSGFVGLVKKIGLKRRGTLK